jgi:predicted PurR-regulated permease PerM
MYAWPRVGTVSGVGRWRVQLPPTTKFTAVHNVLIFRWQQASSKLTAPWRVMEPDVTDWPSFLNDEISKTSSAVREFTVLPVLTILLLYFYLFLFLAHKDIHAHTSLYNCAYHDLNLKLWG